MSVEEIYVYTPINAGMKTFSAKGKEISYGYMNLSKQEIRHEQKHT